jgi:hypothetical protein
MACRTRNVAASTSSNKTTRILSVLLRVPCVQQIGITNVDQQALQQALAADVITFGSPSAVK